MRLASLARKIGVTPTKIASYLEESGFEIAQGSNTKLSDELIASTLNHFNKELPVEVIPEPQVESSTEARPEPEEIAEKIVVEVKSEQPDETPVKKEIEEEEAEVIEDPVPEPPVPVVDPSYLSKKPDEDDEELGLTEKAALNENIKVIKPPKVQLQGLKVKGKIDLPEPKIKEEKTKEPTQEEESIDPNKIIYTSGPKRERRKPKQRNTKRKDPNFNPVEVERKRKEREERKEQERKLKAQKKAKANHYIKTVSQKAPLSIRTFKLRR